MTAQVLPLLLIAACILTAAATTAQEVAWPEVGKLIASDPEPGAFFAQALAIDRDRLVIGALFDNGSDGDSGSVYVFELQAGGAWVEVAKLVPSDDGGLMGRSVAVNGDLIVAGASEVEPDGGASESTSSAPRSRSPEAAPELLPSASWSGEPRLLGVRTSDRRGELRMRGNLGPFGCGRLVQALDATTCLPSPVAAIP